MSLLRWLYYPVSQDAAIKGSCIFNSLFHIWESDVLFPLFEEKRHIPATGRATFLNKVKLVNSSEIL